MGVAALVLGWRPGEFWDATPAELALVLGAVAPGEERAPPDAGVMARLKEMFPDG